MLRQNAASNRMQKESRNHGDCFQFDKAQIELYNSGMANLDDCEPFNISKERVRVTEHKPCKSEGIVYTGGAWLRS